MGGESLPPAVGAGIIEFDPFSNVIDVYIKRLRDKIDAGSPRPLIHTRRGAGYILTAGPEGVDA